MAAFAWFFTLLISAAIAFEDIIVETDTKNLQRIEKTLGHKITPVTLLGGSGWNSQELADKAAKLDMPIPGCTILKGSKAV